MRTAEGAAATATSRATAKEQIAAYPRGFKELDAFSAADVVATAVVSTADFVAVRVTRYGSTGQLVVAGLAADSADGLASSARRLRLRVLCSFELEFAADTIVEQRQLRRSRARHFARAGKECLAESSLSLTVLLLPV